MREILSVGDELVLGQTVDTNSAWLSRRLAEVGAAVIVHLTVADDQPAIARAISSLAPLADCLIITGGIGPTPDDLTRQALADVLHQPLDLDEAWLKRLGTHSRARGQVMPEMNRIQAMIPRSATLLSNPVGTAAGIDGTLSVADHACRIFSLPGVPKEMTVMFDQYVLPAVRGSGGGAGGVILSRALHTFGMGESAVAEKLGDLMTRGRNPSVGTTVSAGIVSLRINARFDSPVVAARELEQTSDQCRQALGDLIYGQDDQTLAAVVADLMIRRGSDFSVTTAESCTGGLLSKMLTDVPGSSNYFRQGLITYANEAKHDLLGVSPALLEGDGAVSEPVARAMAAGALDRAAADVALAITGIAGPTGGTPQKPVGTVWIALAARAAEPPVYARRFLFPGDRDWIRHRSAMMALTLLRYHLLGKTPPF